MLALLEHSPDIYLDELQEQLEEQHNLKVSISTLSNTLKRLGITSKKVSHVSGESYPKSMINIYM
jgi:transposase